VLFTVLKCYQKKRKDLAKNEHRCQDTRCRITFKPESLRICSGSTVHHTSTYVRQDRKSAYRRAYTTGDRAAKFCTVTSNTSGPQYELAWCHPSGDENFKVPSRTFGKFMNPWRKTGRLINSDESFRKSKPKCIRNLKNNHTVGQQVQNHRSNIFLAFLFQVEKFSHATGVPKSENKNKQVESVLL